MFPGQVEDVRIEELEHDDAHLLEASAAEVRHHAEPVFVRQFFLGHRLDHVQEPLGDQPLELAEGLLLENRADVAFPVGVTLAEDQLADFPEQGCGLLPQLPLQFLLPLDLRQPRQLPARQFQEPVHLVIDVGAARRGWRLPPGQQLRDVGLGHLGGRASSRCSKPNSSNRCRITNDTSTGMPPGADDLVNNRKLSMLAIRLDTIDLTSIVQSQYDCTSGNHTSQVT